ALAEDRGATSAERQTAYKRAMRELEGLIAVPEVASEALEQRIAGALERRHELRDDENGRAPA
ncbi:hypothetical protein PU560_08310, partial [Georgenia sp. 10Sc9-8]|nr:hypothetical protein [Georgenia halotolerans]